jgi:DNA-binding MarR family transcriptional regulator
VGRAAKPGSVNLNGHADGSDDILPGRAGKRGPLTAYAGYALRRAQLRVFADFIDVLAELDLRPAQFSVLTLIDANPGIVQARLGETLAIKKANLVPLLNGLASRGALRRVPLDGRSNGLHLTPQGRKLVERARKMNDVASARSMSRLSEAEQRRLLDLLWRIAGDGGDAAVKRGRAAAKRSPSKSAGAPRRGSGARRSRAASGPA